MIRRAVRFAWYRLRATLGRRWSGYVGVVLIIGLVGGVAMASIAGARRTQSSYPTLLASTNPSDLTMAVYTATANGGPGKSLKAAIARLPGVKRVVSAVAPPLVALAPNGAPRLSTLSTVLTVGSLDGMLLSQDQLAISQGRAANQSRANEIVMNTGAARVLGVHVGQVIPFGLYTQAQMNEPGFGTPKVAPVLTVRATLVGIGALNTQVVQDDVDQTYGFVYLDPKLIREMAAVAPGHLTPALYGIQLTGVGVSLSRLEKELVSVVPRGEIYEFHVTSTVTSQVELAIKPESIALGAFGVIASLACLVLAAQALSRLLRGDAQARQVMWAIGAGPVALVVESLVGLLMAIALGSFLAVLVATGLSPLAPLGPVRPFFPGAGFAIDSTVFGLGVAVLVGGLGILVIALAILARPRRTTSTRGATGRRSRRSLTTQVAGVPVTAVVGVHFALESGRGGAPAPVRSVIGGTVLAVAMVVTTLTFASGLGTLISHPPLYGWNWSYLLNPTNDVPPKALSLLEHDPHVAAWSGADYTDLQIDGREVPVILQNPRTAVAPPILSGHGLKTKSQIVLGAGTLALLHKRIGDTVVVSLGTKKDAPYYIPSTTLVVVGTATLPAVGFSSFVAEHTSMGTGALLPLDFTNVPFSGHNQDPNLNGPGLVFVRMRSSVSATVARADLQHIANVANHVFSSDKNAVGNAVGVFGVLRPVQIVNYRSIGSTPIILAVGLALGAVLALGITLASSVRRRRREFALLKTLGFTHRQLASTVSWQATTTALIGAVVGIPLGILVGRQLWTLFAQSINAVPDPTVPVLSVLFVAAGTLLFANLVAAFPGRGAARTPAALALRAE